MLTSNMDCSPRCGSMHICLSCVCGTNMYVSCAFMYIPSKLYRLSTLTPFMSLYHCTVSSECDEINMCKMCICSLFVIPSNAGTVLCLYFQTLECFTVPYSKCHILTSVYETCQNYLSCKLVYCVK